LPPTVTALYETDVCAFLPPAVLSVLAIAGWTFGDCAKTVLQKKMNVPENRQINLFMI
jgi:hypothetical protein